MTREEQRKRFLERIDDSSKNWKFALGDVHEREHWDEYMRCHEDAIRATATPEAPWYVVPADHKWFTRVVVESLDLRFPKVDARQRAELRAARQLLEREQ